MTDKKIIELDAFHIPINADLFVMVDDVVGTAATKKITFANVESNINHNTLTNTHNLTSDNINKIYGREVK